MIPRLFSNFKVVIKNTSTLQKGKKEKRHKRKKNKKAKGGEDNSGPVQISKVTARVVVRGQKCISLYYTFKLKPFHLFFSSI